MSHEKVERNKQIRKLYRNGKGWSLEEIRKEMGFKSRSTVHEIVLRRPKNKRVRSLSTQK